MTIIKSSTSDVQFEGSEDAQVQEPVYIRAVAVGCLTEHVWIIEAFKPGYRSRACNHRDRIADTDLKAVHLWDNPEVRECKNRSCQSRFKGAKA